MFTVDGIEWTIPCDITRKSDVKASDISGMMLNGTYFWDDLGTYLSYEVKLVPNPGSMQEYYALFELLTAPNGVHTFILPYNGETVTLTAHVTAPQDVYVRMPNGAVYWKGCQFSLTSIAPTKEETLGEVIARGLPVLPDVSSPEEGDAYEWDGTGWVALEDADGIAF